jgi:hypothetical protein
MTVSAETNSSDSEKRPAKALLVLRVLLGMALAPGILIAVVAAASGLVESADALDLWMSGVADMLALRAETLALLVALVVAIPGLMLAGLLARPRWWLPAVLPFLLGCLLWHVMMRDISAGYAYPYYIQLLSVLHVAGTGAALFFGWLGSRLARGAGARQTLIALVTLWTGGVCLLALGRAEMGDDSALAFWLFAAGFELGLGVVALVGYWTRENRDLLQVSWVLWCLVALAAVAVGRGLAAAGALAWYSPLPALVVGGAVFSALGLVAAALRRSKVAKRLTRARAVLGLACVASAAVTMALARLFPHPALASAGGSGYVLLSVSPGLASSVEFRADRVRIAGSPDGLDDAPWVASDSVAPPYTTFLPVGVPVPREQLPPGCAGVQARFQLIDFDYLSFGARRWGKRAALHDMMGIVDVGYLFRDAGGGDWTYWVGAGWFDISASADGSKLVEIPASPPDRPELTLSVDLEREERHHVGFGLRLTSADRIIEDVERDGESVLASLVVSDASGNRVVSTRGTLDDLGFT